MKYDAAYKAKDEWVTWVMCNAIYLRKCINCKPEEIQNEQVEQTKIR